MSEKRLRQYHTNEDIREDFDLHITEELTLPHMTDSENEIDTATANKGTEEVLAKRQKWSKHCKFLLLKALKKYGHHDIQQIWKALPDKSLASIRAMIHKLKAKSRKAYKKSNSPLNDWLKCGWLSEEESMVPQALLFIRLFEKHCSYPQESKHDFQAVYHYLYNLMLGCPAQNIPKETENVLYVLLCRMARNVSDNKASRKEIVDFLRRMYRGKKTIRTYPGKKKIISNSSESQNSIVNQKDTSK